MQSDRDTIQFCTLAQFAQGQDCRVQLAHDRPHHVLIWLTRGQGLVLLNGLRRGIGAHNALFIPAGTLFSMDLGRQSLGQAMILPTHLQVPMPEAARHLRIRDVQVQAELTGLFEAALREDQALGPFKQEALEGHAALMSVWVRRQMMLEEHVPEKRNAAGRLSQRYCALLPEKYTSGAPMADYAAALGVTPTHLTRAVKAATGKTAADLLTERVLYEARRLLRDTKEPAQQIAQFLGFGSAAYFTRFVQHHTGATPSKLRSAGR